MPARKTARSWRLQCRPTPKLVDVTRASTPVGASGRGQESGRAAEVVGDQGDVPQLQLIDDRGYRAAGLGQGGGRHSVAESTTGRVDRDASKIVLQPQQYVTPDEAPAADVNEQQCGPLPRVGDRHAAPGVTQRVWLPRPCRRRQPARAIKCGKRFHSEIPYQSVARRIRYCLMPNSLNASRLMALKD